MCKFITITTFLILVLVSFQSIAQAGDENTSVTKACENAYLSICKEGTESKPAICEMLTPGGGETEKSLLAFFTALERLPDVREELTCARYLGRRFKFTDVADPWDPFVSWWNLGPRITFQCVPDALDAMDELGTAVREHDKYVPDDLKDEYPLFVDITGTISSFEYRYVAQAKEYPYNTTPFKGVRFILKPCRITKVTSPRGKGTTAKDHTRNLQDRTGEWLRWLMDTGDKPVPWGDAD